MTTLSMANSRPAHQEVQMEKHVKALEGCDCDVIGVWYNDSGDLSKG